MERETRKQSKTLWWWRKSLLLTFWIWKTILLLFSVCDQFGDTLLKSRCPMAMRTLKFKQLKKKEYRTWSFQIGSVQGRQGRIICWVSPSQEEHDNKKTFGRKNWNANPRKPLTIDNPPKLKTKWCKHLKTDARWKAAANFYSCSSQLVCWFWSLWFSYCIQF